MVQGTAISMKVSFRENNSIVDLREKKLQKQNSIVQHFHLFDVKLY